MHNPKQPPSRPIRRKLAAAAIAVVCAIGAGVPMTAYAADTVRVGLNGNISDAPFYIAARKGFFKEQGLDVQLVPFDAGPKMIAPLGVGQLDVAAGASSAGLFNAAARNINIKIVADKGSQPPGYNYVPILVRKALVDSGKVKSYKDLKGLKIAEAGEGSAIGSILNEAAKQGGFTYKQLDHVYMGYPQHVAALANGAVDGAVTSEPAASQAVASGVAVRFSDDKLYPYHQAGVVLYGGDFITKRPEVAKKFMVAYIKAVRVYNDALKGGRFAGPAAKEVIDIMVQDSNLKNRDIYTQVVPNGLNPDGKVNMDSLKKDFQFFQEQGFLKGNSSPATLVDNSFADAALKVLGPYTPKQ
ncbi:MAG: transporter substrate-binding protein [Massilia sp.]|nr:transporter substrate-binding protein [Massilia sp.]